MNVFGKGRGRPKKEEITPQETKEEAPLEEPVGVETKEEVVEKTAEIKAKEQIKESWVIGSISTQQEEVVYNPATKETLSKMDALVKILNNQEKLMKGLL